MDLINFFGNYGGLLFQLSLYHIFLSLVAILIAIVLAVPLGAIVGHMHKFSFLVINGGNVLRALPTLAIIAIGFGIYGFGFVNVTVALVILAFPLIVTNTYAAVEGVDPGMVEAARGMGMTDSEILLQVELPNAIPLIMSGVRTAWVYVVATAYIAAFAGATGSLGDVIANQSGYGLAGILAASILSILIAFLGNFALGGLQRLLIPTGLKVTRAAAAAAPA